MAVVLPKMQDFAKATALATVSTTSFNKALSQLSKAKEQTAALEHARKAMGMMTNAEKEAKKAAEDASKASKKDADAKKSAASEASRAAEKTQEFNQSFRDIGAELGTLKVVMAAWAAIIGSTVGVVGLLAAKAIEVTEQRSALLATFSALGGGAKAGKETLAMVDKLSEKLPLPAAQIADITKNLEAAGFRGKALGKAVEAVAAATAIMHDEAGGAAAQQMLQTLAEGGAGAKKMADTIAKGGAKSNKLLQKMGLDAKDVTRALKEMGVKGTASADQVGMAVEKSLAAKAGGKGGPLAEMGATFPVMLAKLKEGFFSLFEGASGSVKPFMAAVQSLFGQFTRGKGPMKALGAVATQALGFIFKYATMAVKAISAFVAKNFTAKNVGQTWEKIKAAIAKVAVVLGAVWAVLGPIFKSQSFLDGIAFAFKVIAVVGVAVVATFAAIGAAVGAVAGIVMNFWGLVGNLVGPLIDAVTAGAAEFATAMANMAQKGLAAFKSVLGIASPSKVMMAMGGYAAEGASQGLDSGAGDVQGSAAKLGDSITGGTAKGMGGKGAGAKGGGKSVTVHVAAGALVINAGASTVTDEGLAIALERLALVVGG